MEDMVKYPEEIRKQAEELIAKMMPICRAKMGEEASLVRKRAIKAAIVSCEFTLGSLIYTSGSRHKEEWNRIEQIKAYLEGLL